MKLGEHVTGQILTLNDPMQQHLISPKVSEVAMGKSSAKGAYYL
jgi:hypothetical protein